MDFRRNLVLRALFAIHVAVVVVFGGAWLLWNFVHPMFAVALVCGSPVFVATAISVWINMPFYEP